MVSEPTSPAPSDSPRQRSLPLRALVERTFHTLLPSAVRMIGAGFQFLSTVMVARSLGDEASAPFFFWSSVLMTSGPIATFGLEQIALKQVPRIERQGHAATARYVAHLRTIALLVATLIGLGWFGYAFLTETQSKGFRLWYLLPFIAQGSIALTLLNGEALKGLSRPSMGTFFGHVLPAGIFCGAVALFSSRLDATGILALYTGSFAVGALLARYTPGDVFREPFFARPDRGECRSLLREGFPVCCASLFGALGFIVPLAICELTRPPEEVSHLTAAFRIAILFIVLSGAIHGVFAPALSRSAELARPLRPVLQVYGKAIFIALLALGLPLGFGILFPEWVMNVFGGEFKDGAEALRLLLILQLLSLLMGPVPHLLLMTGHTAFLARLGIGKLAVVVALSSWLIPQQGGVGMVIAMGVGFLCEGLVGVGYAVWQMKKLERKDEAGE